ncbi:MAG: ABC transporter ATP-binding protein [Clostridiales bacterium]|nr:ABC transporter ATP-binding protein [Clostridiales bacterium]
MMLVISTVFTLIAPRISGRLIDILQNNHGVNRSIAAIGTVATYAGTSIITDRLLRNRRKSGMGSLWTQGMIVGVMTVATAGSAAAVTLSPTVELRNTVLMMLGLYSGSTICGLVQSLLLINVSQHSVRSIREDLFGIVQKLPLRFFDTRTHGELMSRLSNDVDNVSNMLSNALTQVLSSTITLVMALSMMLSLSWQLTIIAFTTIPLSMLVLRGITKRTGRMFKQQQAALGELNGIVEETVTGAKVVKVFSREKHVIADFNRANEELSEVGSKATILSSCIGPLMNAINHVGFALMSGLGGYLVVTNPSLSVGMIQSFLQYSRQFQMPINSLANQVTGLQSALAGAERVFEIMDAAQEPADAPDALPLKNAKGHVEFDDVTFGYDEERKILKNVSFEAQPGQTIALVGPTGAGKTTIVNLLMRFYDIDSGTIRIDGEDICRYKRQDLRDSLGMVLQDVYMFAGTIRDNIAYGRLDATDEEITRAAKAANCHDFIMRLPQGYDTVLAEDASNLSQGQRQLLSIARAILADPAILILDEATSSVDTRTEMNIQQAMIKLMENRTSFVIAHRLSTIRGADQILVIADGQIVERGSHEELVAKNGMYAGLLNSQYRGMEI